MSAQKSQDETTEFTIQDRETINKTSAMTQEIYNSLFGSPDHPHDGLFLMCNLNTRFRQNMTKLMWVLIPVILSMGLSLLTMLLSN